MALVIQTQPTEEPIEINEAKQHLRIDGDEDDNLILNLITIARQNAETVTRRAMITQTWAYYLDEWPDVDYIELPYAAPLQSITSLKYTDYAETVTEVTATDYETDTYREPGRLVLAYGESWPTATLHVTSPIEVIYICGYGTPDDVPLPIRQGMLMDIADLFENRETIVTGIVNHLSILDRLYAPYRIELIK